jgi:hypothetical protein
MLTCGLQREREMLYRDRDLRRVEVHRDTRQISCVAAASVQIWFPAFAQRGVYYFPPMIPRFLALSALGVDVCLSPQLVASCARDEPTNVMIFVLSALLVRFVAHSEGVHCVCVLPHGSVHVTRQRSTHVCASLLELKAD